MRWLMIQLHVLQKIKGRGRACTGQHLGLARSHGGMRHEPDVQSQRATRGQRTGLVYTAQHSKGHKTNRSIDPRPPCIARKHACISHNKMQITTLEDAYGCTLLPVNNHVYMQQNKMCFQRHCVSHIFHGVNWPPKLNSSMAVATWQHACRDRELWHANATHFVQNHMPSVADGSRAWEWMRQC